MNQVITQQLTEQNSATKVITIEYLIGPDAKGPQRCIHCYRHFRQGEMWRRYIAPPDPECGTYSFGVHDACARTWQQ